LRCVFFRRTLFFFFFRPLVAFPWAFHAGRHRALFSCPLTDEDSRRPLCVSVFIFWSPCIASFFSVRRVGSLKEVALLPRCRFGVFPRSISGFWTPSPFLARRCTLKVPFRVSLRGLRPCAFFFFFAAPFKAVSLSKGARFLRGTKSPCPRAWPWIPPRFLPLPVPHSTHFPPDPFELPGRPPNLPCNLDPFRS